METLERTLETQKTVVEAPHTRAVPCMRQNFFTTVESLCQAVVEGIIDVGSGLVRLYVIWVVAYTVMEHFAPGLPSEILENLGEAWQAYVKIFTQKIQPLTIPGTERMVEPITNLVRSLCIGLLELVEGAWHLAAKNFPFLK